MNDWLRRVGVGLTAVDEVDAARNAGDRAGESSATFHEYSAKIDQERRGCAGEGPRQPRAGGEGAL